MTVLANFIHIHKDLVYVRESVCFNTPHIFPLCLNILQMLAYVYDGALMLSSFMRLMRKLYCFIKSLVG